MTRAPSAHLHSSSSVGSLAQWSFGPAAASAWLWCDSHGRAALTGPSNRVLRRWDDPLDALRSLEQFPLGRTPGSRWVGFLSYDLGRRFEKLPTYSRFDPRLPLFAFGFFPFKIPEDVTLERGPQHVAHEPATTPFQSTFTRSEYLQAVERILQLIRAGDIFQVNLSQRFTLPQREPADVTWQRALRLAPPLLGAHLSFDGFDLVSLSPELFLQVVGRQVTTRPIKGTRHNSPGESAALRTSTKDAAELNMIIDLERNDLGRVCEIGTVRVDQPRTVESHDTLLHGVASVTGQLRSDVDFVDLLRATFPGGSITGAPKIRAMQIIEELEPVRRHGYCGAIGYLAADGSMQFNVAIRTMTMHANRVHLPVGGGIVADSSPAAEYEETLLKSAAMFRALGISPDEQTALLRSMPQR